MKPLIGCSGFAERTWLGEFYPANLPSREYLAFYAQHLSAVEINSTFYRRPQSRTLANWVAQTPAHFRFVIKMPKAITHIARLNRVEAEVQDFCRHIAAGLGDRLAGFLYQLPPSYGYSAEHLQQVIVALSGYTAALNFIEFRHASWWQPDVMQTLAASHIVMSGVSIPRPISDEVVRNCSHALYYRLHGVPQMFKSSYDLSFLQNLALQLQEFEGQAYVFFNNTYGPAAIQNALTLQQIMSS